MNIFQKTILNTLYYLSVFYQNGHTITKIYKSQIDFYNTVVAAAGCSYGVDCRNRVPSKLTFLLRGLILVQHKLLGVEQNILQFTSQTFHLAAAALVFRALQSVL